ncbi:MAG: efflux RND transporter permease subunit [Albidovulum sp.]
MAGRRDRLAAAGGILSYFTRHATAANLVLVLFLAAGLAALPQMRAQYFPDTIVQQVNVAVTWDDAGPEDVDRGIIQLLLPGLLAVEGVSDSVAIAREGRGEVTLDFEPGWDMARAVAEVETAVAAVTNLPADADPPVVRRNAWRDRVTDMVITGPVAPEQLLRIADDFLDRLYQAGVTRATIEGLAAPEITIDVPMAELMRHDLTLSDIADRIAAETAADPAGSIAGGSARVRTGSERRSPEALRQIVLKSRPDGTSLTLGEVATVTETGGTGKHAYFVGDNPAVALRADRSAEGDAIAIQREVEAVAEAMRPDLPKGVTIDLIRVRSQDIIARLEILIENGLMGLGLVLVMLFLFLNARTALWVAAGIPVAMLAAVAMMYLAGISFNMISLFALILTTGIVVDDAIVVGEHADFRFRRLGEAPFVAAETAVRTMAAPVLSSTATTIVAFLGLMAITGRFGEMLKDIPFTVTVVLAASLLECFLILPNHMAHSLTSAGRRRWYDFPSRVVNRGFDGLRDRIVRPLAAGVITLRYPFLAGMLLLLAYEAGLFLKGEVRWQFFNSPEQASITGNFTMIAGASREDTLEVMRGLQQAAEKVAADFRAEHGVEPLRYVLAEIGANAFRPLESAQGKDADLLGSITIELIDPDLRPWSSSDFVSALQEAAPHHPYLEELSFRGWRHGPGGDALDVQLSGAEPAVLKAAAEDLKHALAPFPEISALEDSLPYDKDELILNLTPQGRALGFTVDALGRDLRARLNGITAASFPDGTRTVDVKVDLAPGEVKADFLDRMLMRSPQGAYVPLADIVTVEPKSGFSRIRREDGERVVSVTGDIAEDDPDRLAEILSAIERNVLPAIAERHGVRFRLTGLSEQEDAFLGEATIGFAAALVGIYVILAWVFSSWTRPIVVMAVIPFGLIGALHGHSVWNLPMSMFSVVGLIGMSGIIVNDAIVLVSTVDRHASGRALIPAVIDAVADRLRAVFLTTATTVIGLAPLLYETSRQAQFLKPTVVTLCYGLGFGMVLVLLVVPALVVVQADVGRRLAAFRRARRRGPLKGYHRAAVAVLAVLFVVLLGPALLAAEGYGAAFLRYAAAAALSLAAIWAGAALRLVRASRR